MITGGAVSGAIEGGGTYLLLQGVGAYSDIRNGRDNTHGSLGQFFTETFVGAAGGALGAGAFGLGGRLTRTALRPLAAEVRYAAVALGRRADDFFAAHPRLNPFHYGIVADRGVMLGANLSTNFKVKYVGPTSPGRFFSVFESMSKIAAKYQRQVTGTPDGQAFFVNGVKFDGFKKGVLLEAKGLGYSKLIKDPYIALKIAKRMHQQASDQLRAVAKTKTPIQWHVAEEDFARGLRYLFRDLDGIEIIHTPIVY